MDEIIKENIGEVMCGQCKWFNIKADLDNVESTCKRLDHKKYQFAKPYFMAYDCGKLNSLICRDFQPTKWCKYLYEHWTDFDDFIGEIPENKMIGLVINGNQSIRYRVRYKDFAEGTFINMDGSLKWVERYFYKQCKPTLRNPVGYMIIYETPGLGGGKV